MRFFLHFDKAIYYIVVHVLILKNEKLIYVHMFFYAKLTADSHFTNFTLSF